MLSNVSTLRRLVAATLLAGGIGTLQPPADAYALAPRTGIQVIHAFGKIAAADAKFFDDAANAYRSGGYKALTASLEGTTDKAKIGAAFLHVAALDGKLPDDEAAQILTGLYRVPGFERSARRVLVPDGADANAKGALQELRAAMELQQAGKRVEGIRVPFRDPAKSRETDIDLVYRSGDRLVAVESKAYAKPMRWDEVAADADTLVHFRRENPQAVLCFLFLTEPGELVTRRLKDLGIAYVHGNPGMAKYCSP